ncbi:MAG TPA: polysaccharide lyase family protein, partial [Chitinophagaceae bacterium]|nr:polysaccharide lyase family protein [Chitinophagaceae bacterium]
ISGRYQVSDMLKPALHGTGAWIGVTDLQDGATNFQFECKNYQYWVKTDNAGNFTIPNIRPGTYSLFAFGDGAAGEYRQDNVVVTAGNTTSLGTITRTIDRTYGSLVWEIGVPDRTAGEFKMGDFDYCEGFVEHKFADSFPPTIEYNTADNNWATVLPYAHTKYPDASFNPAAQWRWRLHFTLPAGMPTTGNARLTIAYASNDHAQQWIYVNNESTPFTTYYPDNGDGNAFIRQSNFAKYTMKQVLIPMSRLVAGSNIISLVMPSNSGWNSHLMYDYLSLEANISSTLPVNLLSFKAQAIGDRKAFLNWKTTNEQSDHHFDIERSTDGAAFSYIGKVAATGATGGHYSFTDNEPLEGINYYRLRQVDNDGKYTYSPVETLRFGPAVTILIYPNPVKDAVTISAPVMLEQIKVSSADGKLIFLQSGINRQQATVNMAAFAKGLYYLEIRTATGSVVRKIIR